MKRTLADDVDDLRRALDELGAVVKAEIRYALIRLHRRLLR